MGDLENLNDLKAVYTEMAQDIATQKQRIGGMYYITVLQRVK